MGVRSHNLMVLRIGQEKLNEKRGLWGFDPTTLRPIREEFKEKNKERMLMLGLDLESQCHED